MSIVRVTCNECGDVTLDPDQLLLSIYPTGATFSFTCLCGVRVVRDARPDVVALLQSAGVPEQTIVLPERVPHAGPPIGLDDLLDMHLALQGDGWERELA